MYKKNLANVNFLVNFVVEIEIQRMANRQIIFYKHYFNEFYIELAEDVRTKLNNVMKLVKTADRIPVKFFRIINTVKGLYEIRMEWQGNIYRVFCCLDKGNIVVLFQGFQKKSQKTPQDQIDLAKKLMNEYFNNKENG